MNAIQTLLTDHLGIWSSALLTKSTAGRGSNGKLEAYGIKKLRELILELAITGRLIGNDTSGWTEALLGEIGEWGSGGTPLKAHPEYYGGDIPWLVIGDLNDGLVTEAQSYITQLGLEKSSAQLVPEGTLLIAMYGSIGKLGIAGIPCATNQAIAFCNPDSEQIETQYLFLYLRAIREHLLSRGQGLAQQNISQKILKATSIKLPRLEEQHRIVAKVDELMALCDQLEQQQTHSLEAHQTLVETLLGTLARVGSQQEFSAAWARIANHFDALFTTEVSIDQIKQTILQLAVMGKLVPQDINDEPARGLLERIAEEKGRLVKEGLLKKQQPLTEVTDAEMPFEIPDKWEWSRLGNLGIGNTGKTPSTGNSKYYGGVIPFIGPGQITPAGEILDSDKNLTESGCEYSTVAEPGDVLMVCIGGSIGKSAITVSRVAFNQQINCIRPIFVSPVLLNYSMNTPHFQSAILEKATGSATPIINRSKWEELLVPIPPEAEQHRIVAKVDELMALCDALKARLADAQAIQTHLADAIVEQAVC